MNKKLIVQPPQQSLQRYFLKKQKKKKKKKVYIDRRWIFIVKSYCLWKQKQKLTNQNAPPVIPFLFRNLLTPFPYLLSKRFLAKATSQILFKSFYHFLLNSLLTKKESLPLNFIIISFSEWLCVDQLPSEIPKCSS